MKVTGRVRTRADGPISTHGKILLVAAVLFHVSLLIPWSQRLWNRFTFDSTVTRGSRGWDFYALYQAGRNVIDGISVYESDDEKVAVVVPRRTPFRYLPLSARTLGVWLNSLPPLWAFRLWTVIVELVLLGCAGLSWRIADCREQGAVLVSMWLLFSPYYLELYLGQFSVIQAALIYALVHGAARGELGWRRDIAWIASLLWKQNTAVFAPVYIRLRRWRALLVAAAVILASTVPYFVRHPGAFAAFSDNFVSGPPSHQLGNLGVRQFIYSLTSAMVPALSQTQHALLQGVWVGIAICASLLVTVRSEPRPMLLLCLWTATYFIAYHDVWEHHYVMLLPIYVSLYRLSGTRTILWLYALTALWSPYLLLDPSGAAALYPSMRWTPFEPPILDVIYHGTKALPALGLWGHVAKRLLRSSATSETLRP